MVQVPGVRASGNIPGVGYVDGKNTKIEYRYAENRLDRLPSLADELFSLRVDVLVTPAMAAAFAAKNATKQSAIVFLNEIRSILFRGLSLTWRGQEGTSQELADIAAVLAGKRLELLKETIPKLSRVALLWNPGDHELCPSVERKSGTGTTTGPATSYRWKLIAADKYESVFKEAIKAQASAVAVTTSWQIQSKTDCGSCRKNRLPAYSSSTISQKAAA